jgi:glucose dehydrogenase
MDSFDLCIIGSGVAGGLLAAALAPTGKRIAIVEAGSKYDRAETQRRLAGGGVEPYFVHNDEHLHVPVSVDANFGWVFQQAKKVGGNSLFWGAWAVRPMPNHFAIKTRYGVGQDWPLRYDALEPFYGEAEAELGVAGRDEGPYEPPRSKPYPLPAFPISYADEQFARACQGLGFGTQPIPVARTSRAYRGRAVCCLAAQCWTCPTEAKYSSDVTHVRAAVATPNVTLIDNAFASRLELDEAGKASTLHYRRPDRSEGALRAGTFVVACNAIESARLLLMSAQKGHPRGLANGSGQVGRNLMVHPSVDLTALANKPLLAARSWPTLFTRHFEDGHERRTRTGFRIAPMPGPSEVLPFETNRVELDPEHPDHFGNPGLRVAIRLSDYERNAWPDAKKALLGIVAGMGAEARPDEPFWGGGGHQMGTLKMGTDKKTSVVDTNLRAHEVPNLYVAGAAVYPSSLGPTNPTLTLAALTLRLARHLGDQLKAAR